jgi:vacuolar iron transporter family protein
VSASDRFVLYLLPITAACFDRHGGPPTQPPYSGAAMTIVPGPMHKHEPRVKGFASRLNWLRAGVLGANDGIASVAAVVVGVAGATTNRSPILAAGVAALAGGAISMALGEYVSVSSQRDSQRAVISDEIRAHRERPEDELEELVTVYQDKGLSPETARQVAVELTRHDSVTAHLEAELGITEEQVVSPWQAAWASALAFTSGGVLPLLAILLPPARIRVPVAFVVVLAALAATGALSGWIGGVHWLRPTVRVVAGGALALTVTFLIGTLLNSSGVV